MSQMLTLGDSQVLQFESPQGTQTSFTSACPDWQVLPHSPADGPVISRTKLGLQVIQLDASLQVAHPA
jgi:hypothetical protein